VIPKKGYNNCQPELHVFCASKNCDFEWNLVFYVVVNEFNVK